MTHMNCWNQSVAFLIPGPLMGKYPSIAYLAYLNPRMAASRMFNRGSDRPKLAERSLSLKPTLGARIVSRRHDKGNEEFWN
jgi:hypothetical protein